MKPPDWNEDADGSRSDAAHYSATRRDRISRAPFAQATWLGVGRSLLSIGTPERSIPRSFLVEEFLINAAGYTGKPNVDACELHKADCLMGNAVLPGIIAQAPLLPAAVLPSQQRRRVWSPGVIGEMD